MSGGSARVDPRMQEGAPASTETIVRREIRFTMPSPEVAARVRTLFESRTTDNRAPPLPFYLIWAEYPRMPGTRRSASLLYREPNVLRSIFPPGRRLLREPIGKITIPLPSTKTNSRRNRPGSSRLLRFTVSSKPARVRIARPDTRRTPGLPRRRFSGPPRRSPTIGIPISTRARSSKNFLISTSRRSWSRRRRTGLRLNRKP